MTKRLQVLLDDAELRDIQRAARKSKMTTAEWVRQQLRRARDADDGGDPGPKLDAIRRAVAYSFPSGDVDQLNAEIQRGYTEAAT